MAGREWSLYFATLPGFEKGAESNLPAFVLASGIEASVLLFGISWMLVRSRILAERASKDLEEANRELEGTNRELEAFSYSVSHDLRAPRGPLTASPRSCRRTTSMRSTTREWTIWVA